MKIQGLPGEFLLLFVIFIWLLFILTLLSDIHNKLNFWCFISGMIFSLGVLKEYLYFCLVPYLKEHFTFPLSDSLVLSIYSVMTAFLYYLAMPCVMIFGFYFFGLDKKNPPLFRLLCVLIFIPSIIYAICCPYINTRDYQLHSQAYYISVAIYNWAYGIISTVMIITPLVRERLTFQYRQHKMVSIIVLLPIWYWLLTAFIFQIFQFPSNSKLWQGNILIVFILLIYYLKNIFKEGVWGTRLIRQTYDWFGNSKIILKNAQYLSHTLKNELAKITWCTNIIKASEKNDNETVAIIENSVEHLMQFISRTRFYSDEIVLRPEYTHISELFSECISNAPYLSGGNIHVQAQADSTPLLCDREHMREVINNLLQNAYEALSSGGHIRLHYYALPKKRTAIIKVSDNGCGIAREELPHIFDPYYTKKPSFSHLGLGLYYCYSVMDKHHGSIKVKSIPGKGTAFLLYFPLKRQKMPQGGMPFAVKGRGKHKENDNVTKNSGNDC